MDELKTNWKINGAEVDRIFYDEERNQYTLYFQDRIVSVISGAIYDDGGKLVTDYEEVGNIFGDREGIRWNHGRCYSCGREVDPYATGCPYCHRSFVD